MRTDAYILPALIAWVACALACPPVCAQTVYRCKTDRGVIYSEKPCGDDAERREMGPVKQVEEESASEEQDEFVDLGETAWSKATGMADDVLSRLGAPTARYRVGDAEYWLYDRVGRIQDGERQLIELLVVEGRASQVNWLSEEIMDKTIVIAREIADWEPPTAPRSKFFYATGEDIRGLSRAALVGRFGQPDAKKIFNGIEVWEYRDVPASSDNPARLTLFVEFEGDSVRQSTGN